MCAFSLVVVACGGGSVDGSGPAPEDAVAVDAQSGDQENSQFLDDVQAKCVEVVDGRTSAALEPTKSAVSEVEAKLDVFEEGAAQQLQQAAAQLEKDIRAGRRRGHHRLVPGALNRWPASDGPGWSIALGWSIILAGIANMIGGAIREEWLTQWKNSHGTRLLG